MMRSPVIYLDYAASTPVDPRVTKAMIACLTADDAYANPASTQHAYGLNASQRIEQARQTIAHYLGTEPSSIVFTSGATESNNLAIFGACRFYQRKGRHIITMKTEHKSVLDCFQALEQEGWQVTYLSPESNGLLNLQTLADALTSETVLASIMHVNNELGVIQDIQAVGNLLHEYGVLFHVDAAQSIGKIRIDLSKLPIDLMSLSAHKNYGPKGVGALFIRQQPRIRLSPLLLGGQQENGLRAGTLATHQIVGMAEALAISAQNCEQEQAYLLSLRQALWAGIQDLPGVQCNGHATETVPGILSVTFQGLHGESLLLAFEGLAVSAASACSSAAKQPSYVLQAIGLDSAQAASTLRFSFGRFTSVQEIEQAIAIIREQVLRLNQLLP